MSVHQIKPTTSDTTRSPWMTEAEASMYTASSCARSGRMSGRSCPICLRISIARSRDTVTDPSDPRTVSSLISAIMLLWSDMSGGG
jgi:hypothetical protein